MHWSHFALLAVCAFAYWQRVPAISRVATVFLLNAAFMTSWAFVVDPFIDPRVQLAVDFISATIIMSPPAKEIHGWFGLLFGVRMGASLHYIVNGGDATDLWSLMNYAGQLMMIILLFWSESHGGKLAGLFDRAGRYIRHRGPSYIHN